MENKSLYQYIKDSIIDGKLPRDFLLPTTGEEEIAYIDGGQDGIYYFHMEPIGISEEDEQIMIDAIMNINDDNFIEADRLFVELTDEYSAITFINDLQAYIYENKETLKGEYFYEYALNLIKTSNNKECIKIGLAILELMNTNNDETKEIIRTLSLSDEFTFYCVKIMKTWINGNQDIYEVAKKVHGWGKIFALEYLRALDPLYEEIKEWILKEGIDNDVSPAYSALTCWRNSNAGGVLYTKPTYKHYVYIRRIIDALLDEGPREGISALDKRKEIIMVFLNESLKMPLSIEDYETIYDIYEYFTDEEDSLEITSLAKEILSSTKAKDIILNAVKKAKGIDLAKFIGIDYKPYLFQLIKYDFKKYYYLCRYLIHDDNYRKELLKIFSNNLPLKQMISTPSDTLGIGNEFFNEHVLEILTQGLYAHPLEGKEFIEVGLQSKPIRTRNIALNVLESWVSKSQKPLSEILPDIYVLLMMLSSIEPIEEVKERMDKLISGTIDFSKSGNINKDALNILADAISDVGSWCWWYKDDEAIQLEFSDVQLYNYSLKEKEAHSSIIALRFIDNSFALFLDNLDKDQDKPWYIRLQDDEIDSFSIDSYEFEFNNAEYVNDIFNTYKNKTTIKELIDEDIISAKYILAAKCGELAFVVGGNKLEVLSHSGTLSNQEIKKASDDWWDYWQDYWRLKDTSEAYKKDFACEVSIPIKES